MLSVALCTYNGAEFIEAQLNSILGQTLKPDEIIICDDLSTDRTVEIINAVANATSIPVKLFVNPERLGVIHNFEQAISKCTGDLVALSDQDDIWLPEKLQVSVEALDKARTFTSSDTPILVHSDLMLVDRTGNLIANSYRAHQGIRPAGADPLPGLLLRNSVTGCTILMNQALLKAALPFPRSVLMHDWWLALVAAACGRVIELPQATMLYRQHDGNVVGARRHKGFKLNYSLRNFAAQISLRYRQLSDLAHYPDLTFLPGRKQMLLRLLASLSAGGAAGTFWLIGSGIRMDTARRNLGLYLLTLTGQLKP